MRPCFPYRYRTLKIFAFSSNITASYAISVRRASALPAASFRSHLVVGTLAVRPTLPPVGCAEDLHLQVDAPCRAHNEKAAGSAELPTALCACVFRDFSRRTPDRLNYNARDKWHGLPDMFCPIPSSIRLGLFLFLPTGAEVAKS
jgi:hypothetical protein